MATNFCRSCNNLMAPREDRVNKRLVYYCKPCNASQESETPVVYRTEIVKSERYVTRAPRSYATTHTLPLPCPKQPSPSPLPLAPCSDQLAKVPDDIITDPTLERSRVTCPRCSNGRAVRITPPVAPSDNRIKIIFVCCNADCIFKWTV